LNCERCNNAQATVHLMKQIDDHKEHLHLCQECAEELEESEETMGVSISSILSNLSDEEQSDEEDLQCDECGLDLETFQQRGRLGCPACYDVFQEHVEPLIKRVHGADEHVDGGGGELGVVPNDRKKKLLEKKLKEAVDEERYEDAAQLRDRIEELEEADHESTV